MNPGRLRSLALLLAVLAASTALALEVLVPKDKAVLDGNRIFVMGTGKTGSEVSVSITGAGKTVQGAVKVRAVGEFFFAVELQPGLNELKIGPEARTVWVPGGDGTAPEGFASQRLHAGGIAACEDCHYPDLAVRGDGYPGVCLACHMIESQNPSFQGKAEDDRHFRGSGSKCGRCHDPHGATDRKLLVDTSENLCGSCHGVREVRGELHAAFADGGCTACHDPHFSGYADQLLGSMEAVCGGCHEDAFGDGHGEELEECTTCHDPHAVMGGGLARGEFGERCAECHEGVAEHANVHPALEEGCESCHHPHSSDHAGMLRADQGELCGECHDVAEPADGEVAHEPAETCTDCHGPHGGDRRQYLASDLPALCLECHEDPREEGAEVHAALDDGCLACHDPHAGYAMGMLHETETAVCAACHDLTEEGPHTAEIAGAGCSCCHAPHASDGEHFLREEASTLLQSRKPCASRPQ